MKKGRLLVSIVCSVAFLVGAFTSAPPASTNSEEPVHWDVFDEILDEAFERSEVMENAGWLSDVYGPRNSKSSGYVAASKWARQKLEDYGLSNARLEPFEFGRGCRPKKSWLCDDCRSAWLEQFKNPRLYAWLPRRSR